MATKLKHTKKQKSNVREEAKRRLSPTPINLDFRPSSEHEDEIDLVELVSILWRRRWLMLGVVVFFVGLAIAYCFTLPIRYEISAQISPGITGYDDKGNPVSAWSPIDIQNWYTQKGYMESLIEKYGDDVASPKVRANSNRGSNLVNIGFAWPDPE